MQTRTANSIYVYKTHILPLSRCDDYQVADDSYDVRGWDVIGADGEKFGKVHELLMDLNAMKVRYLDININPDFLDMEDDLQMIVPIGTAILNGDDENVILSKVNSHELYNYPLYKREPVYIIRDYERAVKEYYEGEGKFEHRRFDEEFYEHENYDDARFYNRYE